MSKSNFSKKNKYEVRTNWINGVVNSRRPYEIYNIETNKPTGFFYTSKTDADNQCKKANDGLLKVERSNWSIMNNFSNRINKLFSDTSKWYVDWQDNDDIETTSFDSKFDADNYITDRKTKSLINGDGFEVVKGPYQNSL